MKKLTFGLVVLIGLVVGIWGLWPRKALSPTNPPPLVETPAPSQSKDDPTDLKHLAELENFFARYHCVDPDNNIADNYLEYAYTYGIDWRLLPAISIQESTCGQHQLYNNWWGFGSNMGLKHFVNIYYGMDYVMNQLRNAAPYHGKTESEILQNYGPHPGGKPSPTYYKEVLKLINEIGS